jgi:hypothetical protein
MLSRTSTLNKGMVKNYPKGPNASDQPKPMKEGGHMEHPHAKGKDLRPPMNYAHRHTK